MKAIELKVNYLKEPMGIDEDPLFFWNCEGGVKQSAYQIKAHRDTKLIWDSGKVFSDKMSHIAYEGKPLQSKDRVRWSVVLWDENGKQGEESASLFEMGLLNKEDFKAKWISGNYTPKKKERYPVDQFRKSFKTIGKIERARLYASARGIYDVFLNGKRIEAFLLTPGMTDYRKRIQYQTYDVTGLLKEENVLEFRLADGWYRGSCAAYGVTNVYGDQTSLFGQLEISYENGSRQLILTDASFDWSNDGPIRFADLQDGEVYDARQHVSYNGKAIEVKAPKAPLRASNNVYVKEHEVLKAKLLKNNVLDFSQNLAGYIRFKVKGEKGEKMKLVFGEVLKEGIVDLSGIQETRPKEGWNQMSLIRKLLGNPIKDPDLTPKQEIEFTCSGEWDEYKTSFAIFGFRYVQVFADRNIDPEDFEAIAVYSDMEETGSFHCSRKDVDQLYSNTLWSMKSNFLDLPTDCPTRERLGWTGDAQVFFNTGAYLMDTAAFFKKWLQDMKDAQYKNGLLPAVLPYQGVDMMYKATGSSVGWADAIYLIPYRYYRIYGDKKILEESWPMIERYAKYLLQNLGRADRRNARKDPHSAYTYEKGVHLGEWLEPEEFRDKVYGNKAKHPEECTAYLYLAMKTICEIAKILGKDEITKKLLLTAENAKIAYNANYAQFDTKRQAKLVRPLALGLYDGQRKKLAEEKLKKAVEDYRYRVGTGFLSTPFLLPVLSEAGYVDTAYGMLLNEESPGWLYEVKQGATSIWEDWEGKLSQNHYSPGAVCEWLFDTMGGIRIAGENRFTIAPQPGKGVDFADVSYKSLYGRVSCSWKKENGKIVYKITVPSNCRAAIKLPNEKTMNVETGEYRYEI